MAIPRIFLDKRTGKIRTALFSNGIEERFDVFTGKLKLVRKSIFTGLLDAFPGAAAAFSFRDLSRSWLGSAVVEVRSSAGGAQGFTAAEYNAGDIEAFTGANDGLMPTWYDQSGEDNDAIQGDSNAQPKIVDAGTLVANGSEYDGTDDTYSIDTGAVPTKFMISTVMQLNGFSNGARVLQFGVNDNAALSQVTDTGSATTVQLFIRTNGTNGRYDWDIPRGPVGLLTMVADFDTFTNTRLYWNGSELTRTISVTPTGTWTQPTGNFLNIAGPVTFSMLDMKELVFWNSDQSANRVGIETNINAHYGIYA
jgi:hypothetical protein